MLTRLALNTVIVQLYFTFWKHSNVLFKLHPFVQLFYPMLVLLLIYKQDICRSYRILLFLHQPSSSKMYSSMPHI